MWKVKVLMNFRELRQCSPMVGEGTAVLLRMQGDGSALGYLFSGGHTEPRREGSSLDRRYSPGA